jgi:hypothetical protein
LAALDLLARESIVACMGTTAALYDFDTACISRLHILDPGVRMRPSAGLMVHQRVGAPLRRVQGRLATAPAWTAIEVARALPRPRSLATLDAALHISACSRGELDAAIREQKGRRGLVFIDNQVRNPELQYSIVDDYGKLWRVDFAWPEAMVYAEYDSGQWHMGREALLHDRQKTARLQECGWLAIPVTVDDVRSDPAGD